jgi:hypothetical protein
MEQRDDLDGRRFALAEPCRASSHEAANRRGTVGLSQFRQYLGRNHHLPKQRR